MSGFAGPHPLSGCPRRIAPWLALGLLACGSPPSSEPAPGAVPLDPPPGDEFRPEDPRWKRVFVASSEDGLHWEPLPGPLVTTASSPQLVRQGGELRVYYVQHGRSIAWVPLAGGDAHAVDIQGLDGGMQVDPCLVSLPDDRLRLYLVHHPVSADPGLVGSNRVLSALSAGDGEWKLEPGVRLEGAWVDPDVVPLPDGGVRMFLTRSTREVASARSPDGLDFTVEEGMRFVGGGVTSTIPGDDGWWMYFHEAGSLGRSHSPDGVSFQAAQRLEIPAPDDGAWMLESPSVLRDGERWLMAYVAAPTSEGQVR